MYILLGIELTQKQTFQFAKPREEERNEKRFNIPSDSTKYYCWQLMKCVSDRFYIYTVYNV